MRIPWGWVAGFTILGPLAGPAITRADQNARATRPATVQELAAKIDQMIEARWKEKGARPGALSGDSEFLRRVYLDVAGRIPEAMEVRDFLSDKRADKRQRLVERLLGGPKYVRHFTNVWRALIVPPNNNQPFNFFAQSFETWLQDRLRKGVPYDQMVREILTAPSGGGNANVRLAQFQPAAMGGLTPIAFYQANEFKPENLAASASRLFLGVKLECAQCHDHPFNKYTRQQFWELAAFFTGMQGVPQVRPSGPQPPSGMIKIPGTEKVVKTAFLDGKAPPAASGKDNRQVLAEWMTRGDNPYFARAAVNRLWAHFFGIGLIDPVDEPGDENPPSHPELLDELARQFVAHNFDLKFMMRAITASRAYQLSSVQTDPSQADPRLFARMAVKGLTPEQLFDSLVLATGYRERNRFPQQAFVNPFTPNNPRGEFLTKFGSQEKLTEFQTSILQALALMNGRFIADATSLERSETLAAILDSPFLDTAEKRIEALFLTTLSRKPRPAEYEKLLSYVNSGGARKDTRSALADVFWALLNSSEFILNH